MKTFLEKLEDAGILSSRTTLKDLWDWQAEISAEWKRRKSMEDRKAMFEFNVGDLVVHDGPSGRRLAHGTVGKIRSILHKNLVVDFGFFGRWKMPPSILKKAPKGAKVLTGGDRSDSDGLESPENES